MGSPTLVWPSTSRQRVSVLALPRPVPTQSPRLAAGDPAEIATLRARLAALEGQSAAAAPKAVASAAPGGILRRGARDLFPATGATEADWKKLRAAAGQPPGRLAAHEREGRASRVEDGLLAEAEAGAVDEELAALELGAAGQDPLQRLLLVQTQLLARLAPKAPADPITAALGSGGSSGKDEKQLGLPRLRGSRSLHASTEQRLGCGHGHQEPRCRRAWYSARSRGPGD